MSEYKPGVIRLANELSACTCDELQRALESAGLALVPAADVPTPEERAVLAFAECVDWSGEGYGPDTGQLELIAEAFHALQLARRAAKKGAK